MSNPVEAPKHMPLAVLVRDYIVPYNTLFAISGAIAFVLGLASPLLVLCFGVSLLAIAGMIVICDVTLRHRIEPWARNGTGLLRRVARLLWPSCDGALWSAGLFWVVLITGVAVTLYGVRGMREASIAKTLADATAPPPFKQTDAPPLSIAVLPFKDANDDAEQDFFVDGITEDLTTDLSRIEGSFVISSQTLANYKGRSVDVRKVGRELNVRYILAGTVRRHEDRARVTVQLTEVQSGRQLWADRFESPIGDVASLQDQVTGRLARSLDVQLTSIETARLQGRGDSSSTAAELLLRARHLSVKAPTRAASIASAQLYGQVLQLEPSNAAAWAGLALQDARDAMFGWSGDRAASVKSALERSAKALEIAPNSAESHWIRSLVSLAAGRREEHLLEATRATELNRNLAPAYHMLALAKVFALEPEQALEHARKALALSPQDPQLPIVLHIVGAAHFDMGNYPEAIRWFLKAIENGDRRHVVHADLAAAYALNDQLPEAHAAVEETLKVNPRFSIDGHKRWIGPMRKDGAVHLLEAFRKAGFPER
jgi:TolB-like protein